MAETTLTSSSPAVSTPTLFTHISLPRNIGWLGAFVICFQCVNLVVAGATPFSKIAGLFPGVNLAGLLAVALVVCLFHAYTYALIGVAVPFSGADYVLSTRVLGAPLGFLSSWLLVILLAMMTGSLVALIPQSVLPTLLSTAAIIMDNPSFNSLALTIQTPQGVVAAGMMVTIVSFLLTVLPQKTMVRVLLFGMLLGLGAWGLILYQFGAADISIFPSAWDRLMGLGNYARQVEQATSYGMLQTSPAGAISAGGMTAFLIFFGYSISTFFAGEVKKPEVNLVRGSLFSLLVSGAVLIGAALLLQRLLPAEWISAQSYLYQSGQYTGAGPWLFFYAAILNPAPILISFVSLAWLVMMINLAQTFIYGCGRILYAWAKDGLAPQIFCYVHPGMKSPMFALLFFAVLVQLGVAISATQGVFAGQMNFVFFAVLAQFIPVLALTLLPIKNKALFAGAPEIVRLKLGPLPVISLVGGLTLLYFVYIGILSFTNPAIYGRISVGASIILLPGVLLGGLIWLRVFWSRARRRGARPAEVFKSLPD